MWKFQQSTGQLFDKDNNYIATGWSGQREGKNNPAMQNVPKTGPLPQGLYTIQAPHTSDHTGPYTMNLVPDPSNNMYGRDTFRIHGAAKVNPELSSEGCIIQVRPIREKIWNSGDHQMQVIA